MTAPRGAVQISDLAGREAPVGGDEEALRRARGARGASGEKPKKPIRANLGDESSFYYDEKLKSWVDRKDKRAGAGGSDGADASGALPPPPTSAPPTAKV